MKAYSPFVISKLARKAGMALLFLFILNGQLFCQKKLAIYKTFGGVVFEMDSLAISSKQVSILLQQNQEAYAEFKIAKRKALIGNIIGFTSGVLVALPLVTAAVGGQPEWALAGVGGGLFLLSISFNSSFRGHAFNAIEMYNAGPASSRHTIKASLHFSGTGGSVILRF
jgi:hypothetical protein